MNIHCNELLLSIVVIDHFVNCWSLWKLIQCNRYFRRWSKFRIIHPNASSQLNESLSGLWIGAWFVSYAKYCCWYVDNWNFSGKSSFLWRYINIKINLNQNSFPLYSLNTIRFMWFRILNETESHVICVNLKNKYSFPLWNS